MKTCSKCSISLTSVFLLISLFNLLAGWESLGPMKALAYRSINDVTQTMKLVKVTHDPKAKCLDGSYPAFYIRKGYGSGSDKFILYLEGGGWCYWAENFEKPDDPDYYGMNFCDFRAKTKLGGTANDDQDMRVPNRGILSGEKNENPEFYNWNLVWFRYCDGGSFSGTSENTYHTQEGKELFFRGWYVYKAIIYHLQTYHGLGSASRAVLTGTSAGGLATILRCDDTAEMLSAGGTHVQCVSDTGFFVEALAVSGTNVIRSEYEALNGLHKPKPNLNCPVGEHVRPLTCWFPEYASKFVRSPILLIQPSYDSWQMGHVFLPSGQDRLASDHWKNCSENLDYCTPTQMVTINLYSWVLKHALGEFLSASEHNHSVFVHSCFLHGQILWWPWREVKLLEQTYSIRDAVRDFVVGGKVVQHFDKSYGLNPSCDWYKLKKKRRRSVKELK